MEKIKDFIYEKSDLLFTLIVVAIAVFIVMHNLKGWLIIDDEQSKYHQISSIEEQTEKDKNTKEEKKETSSNETNAKPEEKNQTTENNVSTNSNNKPNAEADKSENKNNQNVNNQKDSSQNNQASNATQNQNNQSTNNANSQNKTNTQTNANQQQNNTVKPTVRNIKIGSGNTAKSIANSLKSNGIITDEKAFLNELVASGKDTKLKSGNFQIPAGATNKQIIEILTK